MLPNPYAILAGIVVFLAAIAGAFFEGEHHETLKYEAAASAAKDVVLAKIEISDAIGAKVEQAAVEQVGQIHTVTLIQIKEVPKYVTLEGNSHCTIPVGFVRLFNAAAAGLPPVPDAPGVLDGAAAGVDLATVGTVTVTDFGAANENAAKLKAWQDWIAQQQKLGN